MGFLDKFKKQEKKPVEQTAVQSLPIYNVADNFMILVRFNSDIWYEALEFIEACSRTVKTLGTKFASMKYNLQTIISHTAEEVAQESKDFQANKPIQFINQRYYILISGNDYAYARLFDILSLSNPILSTIRKDIEANRSSTVYNQLFEYNILSLDDFKHQNIAPKYDGLVFTEKCNHDDVELIMSKLPSCFSAMDIARVINIYWRGNQISAAGIIKFLTDMENATESEILWKVVQSAIPSLYKKILRNPTRENIKKLAQPIYFWDDETVDPEIEFEPDKSIEEMDEVFQTQYERFNPIDESQFRPIDEKLQ